MTKPFYIPKRAPGRPKGFVGSANRDIDYRCAVCEQPFAKEDLRAKRVSFHEMGRGGKVLRSRTVRWLCVPDMLADPDYDRERYTDSPGLKDVVHGTTATPPS